MKIDFDACSAEDRRMILVSSDRKYRELISQVDWVKVMKLGPPILAVPWLSVAAVLGAPLAGSLYLTSTWRALAALNSSGAPNQSWLERLTTKGEIPLPHLDPTEATRRFKFDLGEPKDGSAYVLNPCVADHYVLPAIANERLAQEKIAAFTQIAATLGAKRVAVVSGETLTTSAAGSADAALGQAAAQIGLGVTLDAQHKVKRQMFMEFDKPEVQPFLSPALVRWAEADPSLRALVNTRLTMRARTAKVNLTFEDTVDIDARATAGLASRRIAVGGKYRQLRASTWSFEIDFWPKTRKA
jgi:hypothetical protein